MTEANYQSQIRSAVRGLWKGVLSFSDFREAMQSTIKRGLTQAWIEGARQCGIAYDELSEKELEALDEMIKGQFEYIAGFRDFINDNSKLNEGKLTVAFNRASLWINRYGEARNQAKVMACSDEKLEWQIGLKGCKEHCHDCLKYNGRVYRASIWNKYDIRPQHRGLSCKGFKCCCGFVITTKPVNRGRPPAMSG